MHNSYSFGWQTNLAGLTEAEALTKGVLSVVQNWILVLG